MHFLPMERPTFTLELRALLGRRRQRELARGATARVGKFAIEQKAHFDFVANKMQFGVDCLMQFSKSPDPLFCHALALSPWPLAPSLWP